MDVLADVIGTLDLDAELYFRATFRGPFSVRVPAERARIRFHLVAGGRCRILLDGGDALEVRTGDLVLVPHGAAHGIAAEAAGELRTLDEVLAGALTPSPGEIVYGTGEPELRLVCGHFSHRADSAGPSLHPLVECLPPLLHVPAREGRRYAWVESLLEHLGEERRSGRIGSPAIVRRLSEIALIEVLRATLERSPAAGPLAALADPVVGRALEAIHADPARPWSLGSLAARAGASRSVLAERFRAVLGTSPMRYASHWRLARARRLLDRRELSIGEIAASVGYASEAAFNRAFKQAYGAPPGRLRASLQLHGLRPHAG